MAVSFSGNTSFLRYPVTERACDFFESGSVTLRTRDEDGIILHAGWQESHTLPVHNYLTLEIAGGILRLATFDTVNGGEVIHYHFYLFEKNAFTTDSSENFDNSPVNITNGEWHTIQWNYDRNSNEVSVYIDGFLLQSQSPITWGSVYGLAADGIAYLHLGGLTSFDNLVIEAQDGFFVRGKIQHMYI